MTKKILKIILIILIFYVTIFNLKVVFEKKDSYIKNSLFYDENSNYDVLILGSSLTQIAVSPLQLERDYEISSYNLANPLNTMALNYWTLVNSLDYNEDVKLVVLECSELSSEYKIGKNEYAHFYIDSLPFTSNKVKMINDLFNDGYSFNESSGKLEFLWNFFRYHNRYKELTNWDFKFVNLPTNRGASSAYVVNRDIEAYNEEQISLHDQYENFVIEDDSLGIIYLEKIIELCKEKNIELLLSYFPGNKYIKAYEIENEKAKEIAEKHNIKYLDVMNSDIYNEKTDYYVDGYHLNCLGTRKVTDYLGRYIRNNYDIPFSKSESFDEEYQSLIYSEQYMLNAASQLEQQIVVALDKKYDMIIGYNSKDVFYDSYYKNFFEDMGINYDFINDNSLIILEKGGENIHYCNLDNELSCENDIYLNYEEEIKNNFKDDGNDISIMVRLNNNDPYMIYTKFSKNYDDNNNVIYEKIYN